jgi:hypothetical protein
VSQAQFETIMPLVHEIAKLLLLESDEHQAQFEEIISYKFIRSSATWEQFRTPFEPNYFWNRAPQNISLTTNHAERFHRTMNQCCDKKTSILRKLHNLRLSITRKICRFNSFPVRRQLHDYILLLQKKARKHQIPQVEKCAKCNTILHDARFQFPVPCLHTCLAKELKDIPPIAPIRVPFIAPPGKVQTLEVIDDWTLPSIETDAAVEPTDLSTEGPVVEVAEVDLFFMTLSSECGKMLDIPGTKMFASNILGIFWQWMDDNTGSLESKQAMFTLYVWSEAKKKKNGVFKHLLQ